MRITIDINITKASTKRLLVLGATFSVGLVAAAVYAALPVPVPTFTDGQVLTAASLTPLSMDITALDTRLAAVETAQTTLTTRVSTLEASPTGSNTPVQDMASDVTYQNTGNRKLIVVAFQGATAVAHTISGYIGSSSPATTLVTSHFTTADPGDRVAVTFVVPVGMYYMVSTTGTALFAKAWEM